MAGLPAARQTDETTIGGPITQGSFRRADWCTQRRGLFDLPWGN